MNAKQALMSQLAEITQAKGWTHTEMAKQLGIHQEAWALCRAGKRNLPLAAASVAGDLFPDLRWAANSYVLEQARTARERRKKRATT